MVRALRRVIRFIESQETLNQMSGDVETQGTLPSCARLMATIPETPQGNNPPSQLCFVHKQTQASDLLVEFLHLLRSLSSIAIQQCQTNSRFASS